MSFKLITTCFYISVLAILTITTLLALYDGGYHTEGGTVAGLAFGSMVSSLLPFYISRRCFRKYEMVRPVKPALKNYGFLIYAFCFPVKLWIIYSNISLLLDSGHNWPLG